MSMETKTELRLQYGDSDGGWSRPTTRRWPDDEAGMAAALHEIEKLYYPERYRVVRVTTATEVEPIEPPDPFTPGSVWYAKEGFTTRTGCKIEHGSRWVVREPTSTLPPGHVLGVNDSSVRFLPKAMLVAEPTEPLVVLPTEPTLGWIGATCASPNLDFWRKRPAVEYGGGVWAGKDVSEKFRGWSLENITGFTEAVAVPKSEYELFVDALDRGDLLGLKRAAEVLRAAVDAAGEGK